MEAILPEIIVVPDMTVFAKKAAQVIMETTSAAIEKKGKATWALCGGRTPKSVFPLLTEPYYRDRIDWKNVIVGWGDERCVPPDHADSNYKLAMDCLLSRVPIPASNILRMPGEMSSPLEAAKSYEQSLKLLFRFDRPFPKFDLMLLGMGEDGHTASLFPGTDALDEKEKWVVGHHVEKVSSNRITLTFPVLNNARTILILCPGENKATVVRDVFWEQAPRNRYPIQRVKPAEGKLIWLIDKPAASKLTSDATRVAKYIA